MRKSMFIVPFIVSAACALGFLAYSPSASAALEGENGRVLYTDNENQNNFSPIAAESTNGVIEPVVNQVITTNADGTGDVVAATTNSLVETSTISKPDDSGNSTIVYSEENYCAHNGGAKVTDGNNACVEPEQGEITQVSISKVTIDKDGNPITTPEKVVTFDPLFESGVPAKNSISELSISPDGKNVLVTRTSDPGGYSQTIWESNTGNATVGQYTESTDLELGLKFKSSIDGYITGARILIPKCKAVPLPSSMEGFYCEGTDLQSYVLVDYNINLWTKSGTMLASTTNVNKYSYLDQSNWQEVYFVGPIEIEADKTYIISYSPGNRRYSYSYDYFTNKVDNGALTALKSTSSNGGNGVYSTTRNDFPTETFRAMNYWVDPIFRYYPLTTIENVNLETGEITTIVEPRVDRLVSGGYAQNGNIYFSRTDSKNGKPNDNEADIWVIEAGQTKAVRLTKSPRLSEFFIDTAPDNSVVLVANVFSDYTPAVYTTLNGVNGNGYCKYPFAKYRFYTECDYYYISTADGSREKLKKLAEGFVPVFFSPDGNYLIGTLYPVHFYNDAIRQLENDCFEQCYPVTAIVARNNLKHATKISDLVGVQEWAPLAVAQTTTTNPTVSTVVSGPTLPKTGTSEILVLAYAVILLAVASVISVKSYANLKK